MKKIQRLRKQLQDHSDRILIFKYLSGLRLFPNFSYILRFFTMKGLHIVLHQKSLLSLQRCLITVSHQSILQPRWEPHQNIGELLLIAYKKEHAFLSSSALFCLLIPSHLRNSNCTEFS
jgi:hypothetical protein